MRKRSKYRPKGVYRDPVSFVLNGLKPVVTHPAAIDLRIKNHSALTSLTKGTATRAEIDVLVGAFNIMEAFMIINPALGEDWAEEITAGQDALYNVACRGAKDSKFVLTGPEMTALNTAMEIHEAQLEKATVNELEKAIDTVNKTISLGRSRPIKTK